METEPTKTWTSGSWTQRQFQFHDQVLAELATHHLAPPALAPPSAWSVSSSSSSDSTEPTTSVATPTSQDEVPTAALRRASLESNSDTPSESDIPELGSRAWATTVKVSNYTPPAVPAFASTYLLDLHGPPPHPPPDRPLPSLPPPFASYRVALPTTSSDGTQHDGAGPASSSAAHATTAPQGPDEPFGTRPNLISRSLDQWPSTVSLALHWTTCNCLFKVTRDRRRPARYDGEASRLRHVGMTPWLSLMHQIQLQRHEGLTPRFEVVSVDRFAQSAGYGCLDQVPDYVLPTMHLACGLRVSDGVVLMASIFTVRWESRCERCEERAGKEEGSEGSGERDGDGNEGDEKVERTGQEGDTATKTEAEKAWEQGWLDVLQAVIPELEEWEDQRIHD